VRPVAIVTGASAGIGAAVATALAHQGYALVLAARSVAALERLAGDVTRSGGAALPIPTDVTRPQEIDRLVRLSLERFGRIDVLVNNAGVGETRRTAPDSDGSADLTLHTNLLAPIQLARLVAPTMVAQGSGHIINVTSVASHVGIPGRTSYAASKHGLYGYSEALRRELRPAGVAVSMVSPGFIRTAMTSRVPIPMPGPDLVARAVVGLLLRPQPEVVVPAWYHPLIWIDQWFPRLIDLALTSPLVRLVRRDR